MRDPTKNLGLIGSAVLTFIGYKQTDKQSIYMEDLIHLKIRKFLGQKARWSLDY